MRYMRQSFLQSGYRSLQEGTIRVDPAEGNELDTIGELFDVPRQEGETDEAYRERIMHRAYPNSD